jgi:thioredoxin 1
MAVANSFETIEPTRAEIDALPGATVLEFGAPWCGWCQAAIPLATAVLSKHADVRHIKVEDGSGQPLGRSFRIKLWPTFIFLRGGTEVGRVTRPGDTAAIERELEKIVGEK